jgi:hypothetical protein
MALEGRYGAPIQTVATCTTFSFILRSRTAINYFECCEDLKRSDHLENMDVGRKILLYWHFNQQVIN